MNSSSSNVLPIANNKERKHSMNEFKEGIINRLFNIFSTSSSDEPISLKYTDRVYITNCLKKIQSSTNEEAFAGDEFLSNIKENIAISFEQKEYKEREKQLFREWAMEDKIEADRGYNKVKTNNYDL